MILISINIYSGGASKSGSSTPRVSSAKQRAEATTKALGAPAEASSSGSTAVKSGGILGKILPFVGKVANVVGSVAPGPIGAIAKMVGNITSANDPEWWQTVPGDGLSTNAPLKDVKMGEASDTNHQPLYNTRPAMLEFEAERNGDSTDGVIDVTTRMATQYLMPAVRKVVNAVALQDAASYARVFAVQCTLYAMWRCLKKFDFFIKHGTTFLPNINDEAFPALQVKNAAWLQSTITRLEEYLHANVRLPHTVCEYLTWRFGRIFRTNNSAKAAFVFYNVIPMQDGTVHYDTYIASLMTELAETESYAKAVSDLYNAYSDHDQEVLITDSSLCMYDSKEFCLRTNLDLIKYNGYEDNPYNKVTENTIVIDSNLDNPTVFMASTISSSHGGGKPLFPVYDATAFISIADPSHSWKLCVDTDDVSGGTISASYGVVRCGATSTWAYMHIRPCLFSMRSGSDSLSEFLETVQMSIYAKALDFYNVGIFATFSSNGAITRGAVDMTSISIDAGSVPDLTIENEQVIAFANLVAVEHKDAQTYKKVERRVARDVADFVESNDVAALAK